MPAVGPGGPAAPAEAEIEITPEMIEAGSRVAAEFDPRRDSWKDREETVIELYRAMRAVEGSHRAGR